MIRLSKVAVAAIAAALAGHSAAAEFSVSPVRIFMTPRDRAIAVTVVNEGNEPVVMQADLFVWKQKAGGEDELTPTEDMILSPPILKLAPQTRQVVRLARLAPPSASEQMTYRMIVREIPEARPASNEAKVQVALAFSLPVFITPPGARRVVQCRAERAAADTVRAVCGNSGNAYAQMKDFILTRSGEKLATREGGGYILPTITRAFDLKRPEGPIAGGPAKLEVTFDDGSPSTFDVLIPN